MTNKEFCKVIASFSLWLNENTLQHVTNATLEDYFKSIQYLAIKEMIEDEQRNDKRNDRNVFTK